MKKLIYPTLILVAALLSFASPASAKTPLLREFEEAFIRLGEEVLPSVVEIEVEGGLAKGGDRGKLDELFRFFGTPKPENHPPMERRAPSSTGSGFIFDAKGHIITNHHVVDGASKIKVLLWDGTEREAVVIGEDAGADIAVIKIDPEGLDLHVARMGDSDSLKVGQFAIAMGSPRGLTGSVSFGHVSALGREELDLPDFNLRFQGFIQTDAAINLGNSGGPLCNIDGEVIGVNIAIVFAANSIGFAIPANRVKEIVPQLIELGRVVRGWLGVSIQNIDQAAAFADQELQDYLDAYGLPDQHGALVKGVTWGGPSAKAGLKEEDIIRKIDGKLVQDTLDLITRVSAARPGTKMALEIWREGELLDLDIAVHEFPNMATAVYGKSYLGIHVEDHDAKMSEEQAKQLGLEAPLRGPIIPREEARRRRPSGIEPGSPAEEGGLQQGDMILKVAQKDVANREDFRRLVREHARPGKTLLIRVWRVGEKPEDKFIKVPEDFRMD